MEWKNFRRFSKYDTSARDTADEFFGCVDAAGEWFDSAFSFETAVHWCCMAGGEYDLSPEQEIAWMNDEGCKRGLSVIHGSQIKRMYEAGLIN
jgi:hypothetical protein